MLFPDRPIPGKHIDSAQNSRGDAPDLQRRADTVAAFKKTAPPQLGEAFASVHYHDKELFTLPGGGVIQFDLNKLKLQDFRAMKDHYQVNASLSVLMFLMHQLDWKIVSDNAKVATFCEQNMREVWTRLVRALSQAFWAGYSPNILQWENDIEGRAVKLTKIKDLLPERCDINWDYVEGYAPPGYIPPKIPVYNGIKQYGLSWPIPRENTLWYTLLKENDNWYGRKLLRPAFTPWYFSILVHMFSNRYYERYGEPTPVGRAPMETITLPDGTKTTGMNLLAQIISNFRSGAVAVLPDDRSLTGTEAAYDYQIEYLESQMRGADFERYLMRLDEEISLALFTPLLMLRTADVGSYNLGNVHKDVFQQMLNALSGDWAEYIDRYILAPLVNFNFGPKAKRAHIKFRKLGAEQMTLVTTLLQALMAKGNVKPDVDQLGEIAGLTLTEVQEVTAKDEPAGGDPNAGGAAGDGGTASGDATASANRRAGVSTVRANIQARVAAQLAKATSAGDAAYRPDLGYQRQLADALGVASTDPRLGRVYAVTSGWLAESRDAGVDGLTSKFDTFFAGQLKVFGDVV